MFHCLSQHMTFSDMFGVFFGQPGSLNHLRGPLQTFVRQRCLHDTEPTDANFNKATDDLVEEITSEFEEAVVFFILIVLFYIWLKNMYLRVKSITTMPCATLLIMNQQARSNLFSINITISLTNLSDCYTVLKC